MAIVGLSGLLSALVRFDHILAPEENAVYNHSSNLLLSVVVQQAVEEKHTAAFAMNIA